MTRREKIIQSGLTVLRAHGYPGFTQARVAAEAGMRQSNVTYHFPTRIDLLTAVARAAIDGQLAAIDAMLDGHSVESVSAAIVRVTGRHASTRVMMALAQAADQEPVFRDLFRELADGLVERVGALLKRVDLRATKEDGILLHALGVGLAVVDLAVYRPDGERRALAAVEAALNMMEKRGAVSGTHSIGAGHDAEKGSGQ